MNEVLSKEFGLTENQTTLMFSLQYLLTYADFYSETDQKKKGEKLEWLNNWTNLVDSTLKGVTIIRATTLDDWMLKNMLDAAYENSTKYKVPFYLILLELSLFTPYFPLSQDENVKLKYAKDEPLLKSIAEYLSIEPNYVHKFIGSYKKAIKGLTNFWGKVLGGALIGAVILGVTGGLAAPFLATFFASAGLSGAAAIASGLAVLGGGAIVAGGLGMAGGIAVIVGGGALLGLSAGSGVGALLANAPKFTLQQAAKLEVAMREILIGQQKDVRLIQEIIKEQRSVLKMMEDKLFDLESNKEQNKKEIKNLKETIDYLKRAIERNR